MPTLFEGCKLSRTRIMLIVVQQSIYYLLQTIKNLINLQNIPKSVLLHKVR